MGVVNPLPRNPYLRSARARLGCVPLYRVLICIIGATAWCAIAEFPAVIQARGAGVEFLVPFRLDALRFRELIGFIDLRARDFVGAANIVGYGRPCGKVVGKVVVQFGKMPTPAPIGETDGVDILCPVFKPLSFQPEFRAHAHRSIRMNPNHVYRGIVWRFDAPKFAFFGGFHSGVVDSADLRNRRRFLVAGNPFLFKALVVYLPRTVGFKRAFAGVVNAVCDNPALYGRLLSSGCGKPKARVIRLWG